MADKPIITTNNQLREYKDSYEVPKAVLDDYDWLDEGDKSYGWINYRNTWYHISDFLRLEGDDGSFKGWDGYHGHGFYSGVLIKFGDDPSEEYIIGSYSQ